MYKILLLLLLLITFVFIISFCQKLYEPMEISFNEIRLNETITNTISSINGNLISIRDDLANIE
jgi:preprotein translocase subunit YajC